MLAFLWDMAKEGGWGTSLIHVCRGGVSYLNWKNYELSLW
jgi:hypothetical protein